MLSFKEEKVRAVTFMAYTIQYKGKISNSKGYSAVTEDVWLYALVIKNFIKMTQIQDDFVYNEELIKYSNPNKQQQILLSILNQETMKKSILYLFFIANSITSFGQELPFKKVKLSNSVALASQM